MMLICLRLLLLLVVAGSSWGAETDSTIIRFKAEAQPLIRTYRLADVIDVVQDQTGRLARLLTIDIGRTPRPGQLRQLTRFEVNARLERLEPGIVQQLQWAGSATIQIRGGGIRHDGNALAQVAYQQLHGWLQQHYGDIASVEVAVNRVGEPDVLILPQGDISYHPRLSAATQLRKRMSVWVDVQVDSEVFQTVPVWFAVSVTAAVWIATQSLAQQALIQPDAWVVDRRDIAGLSGDPVIAESVTTETVADRPPKDQRLRHRVARGDILMSNNMEALPLVHEGELITVAARHGTVALAVKALALSDGEIGERIPVASLSSGQSYRAVIVGKSRALVD
ncbi:MAG: flagellar basal body P-ring formation chaperone FlgA [Pseudomonadales bacterium]